MSAGALAERPRLFEAPERPHATADGARPCHGSDGGRVTLEQRLDCVWEVLFAGGVAECPVCHGRMVWAAARSAAHCGGCGSVLS